MLLYYTKHRSGKFLLINVHAGLHRVLGYTVFEKGLTIARYTVAGEAGCDNCKLFIGQRTSDKQRRTKRE